MTCETQRRRFPSCEAIERPFHMSSGSMKMSWFQRMWKTDSLILTQKNYATRTHIVSKTAKQSNSYSPYRSTDSTLKLWNVRTNECVRTYTGHINEKNFVGLSSNSDWISCGSENNAVYTYYKSFRSPLACVKFGGFDPLTVSL